MAPLSMLGPDSDSDGADTVAYGDRGQLLLVAVLVLAASFIILALVVNSAIFTENTATRQSPPGSQDALEHRAETADAVASIIEDLNQDSNVEPDTTDLDDAITSNLARAEFVQQGTRGRILVSRLNDWEDGYIVAQQNSSRELVDANGQENYLLAQGVEEIRNIQFELHSFEPGGSFTFEVDGDVIGGWSMTVREDSGLLTSGGVKLEVQTENGTASCTRPSSELNDGLTIDVTGGTMAGEACHALDRRQTNGQDLWFGSGVRDVYGTVRIQNGNEVTGTYSMVFNASETDIETPNFEDITTASNPEKPYFQEAVYSVQTDFEYATHAVEYRTQLNVTPGEAPP